MKRIKAACICQTIHFMLKDNEPREEAARAVQYEVARYREQLERGRIQHRILSQELQPDGSVLLKIIKQYNTSPVGSYLD